jgi:SAM-dependent methyltransferase
MRLNLGCGHAKLEGFVNCDLRAECAPDRVVDLEQLPWPFADNCAEEVVLNHVLEHLGESSRIYLAIIKELYRICRPDAVVRIAVPHPRHDDFLTDPTHVRAILPEQLQMFSKAKNREWRDRGFANTPLAEYLDVDFDIEDVQWTLDDHWIEPLRSGQIDSAKLAEMARHQWNILKEARITLRVRK